MAFDLDDEELKATRGMPCNKIKYNYNLIKKLETIIKTTNDTRINVDITDLQKLIQEIKNQEKIIDEILKSWKQDDMRSIEELRKYFEMRCK